MKNLYVNGCSFTYGHILPKEQTWPELLSKKLNLDLINQSKNGQSFSGIVWNTIDSLIQESSDETLVIIGFTWSTRYHIRLNDENWDISPAYLQSKRNKKNSVVEKFSEFYKELTLKDTKLEHNQNKKLELDIILLESFLKQRGFNYRFINWGMVEDISNFDTDNIILFDQSWRQKFVDITSHPSKEGCENISEKIYDSINR
tara:strand:- start:199 stop:804 length:606 start_codon:yes stop_codon:yes gene_type:complete